MVLFEGSLTFQASILSSSSDIFQVPSKIFIKIGSSFFWFLSKSGKQKMKEILRVFGSSSNIFTSDKQLYNFA